jgi:hypothetical protein
MFFVPGSGQLYPCITQASPEWRAARLAEATGRFFSDEKAVALHE